jgi:hypothetical protein
MSKKAKAGVQDLSREDDNVAGATQVQEESTRIYKEVILFNRTKPFDVPFFVSAFKTIWDVIPENFSLQKHLDRTARNMVMKLKFPGDDYEADFSIYMKVEKGMLQQQTCPLPFLPALPSPQDTRAWN